MHSSSIDDSELIFRSLSTDRKIAAIKLLRAVVAQTDGTVLGLRDAKNIVDTLSASRGVLKIHVYSPDLRELVKCAMAAAGFSALTSQPNESWTFGR